MRIIRTTRVEIRIDETVVDERPPGAPRDIEPTRWQWLGEWLKHAFLNSAPIRIQAVKKGEKR